jgi:hypothetical protein
MVHDLSRQELEQSREWIDALFKEVQEEEGTLAGGETLALGPGGQAVQALRESSVRFGHPHNRLTRLTPRLFSDLGIELDPIQRQQMDGRFDFYYLTLAVSPYPKRGAQFQLLECRLTFPNEEAIIQSMFPEPRWRKVLEWGGGMKLGLNGNLEWEAGIPGHKIGELAWIEGLPQARIKDENEMTSFIAVSDYAFSAGRPEITAVGLGDTQASWRLQNPELQEGRRLEFVLVFKVPAATEQVQMLGKVIAEPKIAWLTAQIGDVFGELSATFHSIFGKRDEERTGAERLPIGAYEKWTLTLPGFEEEEPPQA